MEKVADSHTSHNMPVIIQPTVTPTNTVTLTNKTLTSPKINEAVALTPTATELNNLTGKMGAWTAWTPVLTASTTNPNIGTTGTKSGRYCQIGKMVFWSALFQTNGTGISAGTGNYNLTVPVTPVAGYPITGQGWIYNGAFIVFIQDGGRIIRTDGTVITQALGMTAAGHVLTISGSYEAA